jgi:hypothetical protein
MASVADFFEEVNELFGFYFDIRYACQQGKLRLEEMQRAKNWNGESVLIYGSGPPQYPPEQQILVSPHATTISNLLIRLSLEGPNSRKAAEATVVFVYELWEVKYRRNLFGRDGNAFGEISLDIMGDLRLVRNCILHRRGIADESILKCRVLTKFKPNEKIVLDGADMTTIVKTLESELQKYAC